MISATSADQAILPHFELSREEASLWEIGEDLGVLGGLGSFFLAF